MIDTKFKNADDKTSLQALWVEVEKLDIQREIDRVVLSEKARELEDGLAKRVKVAINHNSRLRELEGNKVQPTTPEKKSIWDFFLKR